MSGSIATEREGKLRHAEGYFEEPKPCPVRGGPSALGQQRHASTGGQQLMTSELCPARCPQVQRHRPIAAVRPHHSVILLAWSPPCAAACLGKRHTWSRTSPKGPGDHHRPPGNSGSTALTSPGHSKCRTLVGDHPVPLPGSRGCLGVRGGYRCTSCLIPAERPLSALLSPLQEVGSPVLGPLLELTNSRFPLPQLTTTCPAGAWAGSGDSAPPRGPIGLPHFNIGQAGKSPALPSSAGLEPLRSKIQAKRRSGEMGLPQHPAPRSHTGTKGCKAKPQGRPIPGEDQAQQLLNSWQQGPAHR